MNYIQQQTLLIHLIFGFFIAIQGQTLIKPNGQCSCEQILYQEECQLLKKCQYADNKCVSKACNSLDISLCGLFSKCARVDGKCVDFISCSSHKVNTLKDCQNLHSNCYFDSVDGTCKEEQPFEYELCSEQSLSFCLFGKEGLCAIRDGKCQEMISCSEVKYNSPQCYYSYPACNPSKDDHAFDQCLYAKEKINSDIKLLCQSQEDQCIDYDPNTQTKETCIITSNLNFHWNGNRCTKCNQNSFAVAMSIIAILGLSV